MARPGHAFASLLIALLLHGSLAAAGSSLSVSADGHSFVRSDDNEPVFWLTDTLYNCWSNASRDDIRWFLDKRQAMGYSTIKFYADMRAANIWEVDPQASGTYSDEYYRFVDFIIEQARVRGMYVNFVERDKPRIDEAQWRWLGERYREQGNIIWTAWNTSELPEARQGLADGLAGVRQPWSGDHPGAGLFFLNTYYSGDAAGHRLHAIVGGVGGSDTFTEFTWLYEADPTYPIVHADGYYTDANTGIRDYRRSMWRQRLLGAWFTAGHDDWYGACCGWNANVDQDGPARTALYAWFWREREWWKPVRAMHRIAGGHADNVASAAPDGSALYVYLAAPGTTTIDLSAIDAPAVRCTWLDVRDGAWRDAGTHAPTARGFDLPNGWEDGLLVAEPAHDRPLVSLTAPELGSSTSGLTGNTNAYYRGDDIQITATTAAFAGRSIDAVEFLVNGEAIGSDDTAPYEWTFADVPAGTYCLQARAIDSAGEDCSSPVRCVAVWEPQHPAVAFTTPTQLPPAVVGQDYRHYLLSFETTARYWEKWQVTGDLPPGMGIGLGQWGGQGAGLYGVPTSAGSWQYDVRVFNSTDEGHSGNEFGSTTETFTQIVRPDPAGNPAPQVTITTSEIEADLGAAVAISGSVTDSEAVTIWWEKEWGPGLVTFADAAAVSTSATFSWPGFYELRLYADDGSNMWQWGTVYVTVRRSAGSEPVNQPPVITAGIVADPDPVTGTVAGLSVTADDDGGADRLHVSWSASGPEAVAFAPAQGTDAETTSATFQAAGTYHITVVVRDDEGATATDSIDLDVIQTPTVVEIEP